jgi:RimJ/RimL family protein N-acetyltransferase
MAYKVLHTKFFSSKNFKIIPIRDDDKFVIMKWRNEQIEILRQATVLTEHMQSEYFKNVVSKDFYSESPKQILFSFLLNEKLIGYGGLVHISWEDKRSEVSFLLETSRNQNVEQFKTEYGIFLNLIKQAAFQELKLNKLTTEAFDLRPYLIETLEKNGFVLEGRLKSHNLINGIYRDSLLHACFNSSPQ